MQLLKFPIHPSNNSTVKFQANNIHITSKGSFTIPLTIQKVHHKVRKSKHSLQFIFIYSTTRKLPTIYDVLMIISPKMRRKCNNTGNWYGYTVGKGRILKMDATTTLLHLYLILM